MKNSKKIAAFLLSAFMVCAVPTVVSACSPGEEQPPVIEQPNEPSKVKDGTDISVKVGASSTITVSEYITANGKTVTVQSSNPAVATAELKDGVVTVLGKAKGTAVIKLKCESVEVSFNLTVTAEEVVNTPAPVFENLNASLDLNLDTSVDVDLAPKSGGDKFNLVYTLANSLASGAEISGNKLTFTPTETGNYEITVAVKCTEKDNSKNVYDLTFKVTVEVTETKEEKVYFKVSVDGVETQVESGEKFTLPEFSGTVPDGKLFKCWKVGEEEKAAGEEITVTANVTVTAVFRLKEYTVTIDGETRTVEHGTVITLPEAKQVEEGKQFTGWSDGTNIYNAGSDVTVTGDLTITAVIEDLPETPPALVKESGAVELVVDSDRASATINISEYITTNGYAVSVKNSNHEAVEVQSTPTVVTVTALKFGSSTVQIICGSLTVNITVTVKYPPSQVKVEEVTDEQVHDLYAGKLVIDLADNITYNSQVTGYKVNGEDVEGSTFTVTGNYTEAAEEITLNVTAILESGSNLEYTYKVTVKDTTENRVVNGSFTDGLDGWTLSDNDNPIGVITDEAAFWEGLPMFNVGDYFRGESKEGNTGTLTSSTFKVGGINKITFMLGAAGNADCYITLENTDGDVLAIWRNTKFEDVGDWDIDEIGKTQFACNLVTYVADLSEYAGQTLKIVLHDNAQSGFGFFNFDELITYYAEEGDLPENSFVAVNQLAYKTELKTVVEGALTERGDYTQESFDKYTASVAAAQEILDKLSATQTEVDGAKAAIQSAYEELQVRVPEEKTDAEKSFLLLAGNSKELTISDYVYENELSSLTYEVTTGNDDITVSEIVDGKFTITAGSEDVEGAKVIIVVKYNGETVLTVEIAVTVTNETAATLKHEQVEENIDLYLIENKDDITLDFANNVENVGGLDLTYNVTLDGEPITFEGSSYTYTFGSYTDTATEVVFEVTVSFNHNGEDKEIGYDYILNITDTTAYRVKNGSFESGDLTDWTYTRTTDVDFGRVTDDNYYWMIKENYTDNIFNKQGDYLFTGVETVEGTNQESGMGTLKSSPFILKRNGWISFRMGGAHNVNCGVRVRTVDGDIILAEFNNLGKGRDSVMDLYKYKFTGMAADTECYIEVFDNATGDWGLVTVDDFQTYFGDSIPEGIEIAPYYVKGQIYNAGFEKGDLSGWEILTEGMTKGVINADTYWAERLPFNNSGYFLSGFDTGIEEADSWAVRSTTFTLTGSGYISLRMGGNAAAVKVYKANGDLVGTYKPNHFSADDALFPFEGDGDSKGSWAGMRTYFIDLSAYLNEELYIELHDTGNNGGWSHAFFDEIVTYYETVPEIDNGYDTVTAPVSKTTETDDEGKPVDIYEYGEVQLKWRLAVKEG